MKTNVLPVCDLEFKVEDSEKEGEGQISGYAAVFGNKDQGGDIVVKGAFANTLKRKASVPMLWQHDPWTPIGHFHEMVEDSRGLKVKGTIVLDVAEGQKAHALLKAGSINGLSIGYKTIKATPGPNGTRKLEEVELMETSVVTFPMNQRARVASVKEEDDTDWTIRDVEDVLREGGASHKFAKLVAQYGYKEACDRLEPRDEGLGDDDEDFAALVQQLQQLTELVGS